MSRANLPIGVLVSGRGSNLQSILRASAEGRAAVRVVRVLADRDAPALAIARHYGVPAEVRPWPGRAHLADYDHALAQELRQAGVEAVALAGYLRRLGPVFLDAFPGAVLNIHPSLLPSFPGLDAPRQALHYGVRVSGCTVHFVDQGLDSGPIILQRAVPVRPEDREEDLRARILAQEHRLYPQALDLLARGQLRLVGRQVLIEPDMTPQEE